MTLQKKVILITGASRGLGKALAELFSHTNTYRIYTTSREPTSLPKNWNPLYLDLAVSESVESVANYIMSKEKSIDILINNAALAYYCPTEAFTISEAKHLFDVNVLGTFHLTQCILPIMRKQKSGKILFVSSIRGIASHAYMGMYSATKSALESIAFDLATTLSKWNIEVAVVQPGALDSGIELKHGSFFEDKLNPYEPYVKFGVEIQPVKEAAIEIFKRMRNEKLPFRFQTSDEAVNLAKRYLKDIEGNEWLEEQKSKFL